jgi:hypothetical protein
VRAAIKAAGHTGDRSFVYPLVRRLGEDPFETAARRALAAFDPPVLGTLYDYLVDSRMDVATRCRIPPIFVEQSGGFAVTILVRGLCKVCVPVRHAITRALSKLHKTVDASGAAPDELDAMIEHEAEHYAALGQILRLIRADPRARDHADPDQLRRLRREGLERIFRLLGLRYNQRDIYDAYLGITSPDPTLQDSAVEFVDNLVDYDTRRYLLPLLDDPASERVLEVGGKFFDREIRDWQTAEQYLRAAEDPRLTVLLEEGDDAEVETMLDPEASSAVSPAESASASGRRP